MKECYNTSQVLKRRKQLISDLRFFSDTAEIFSEMKKTLKLIIHGISYVILRHVKVFTKCFNEKSLYNLVGYQKQ